MLMYATTHTLHEHCTIHETEKEGRAVGPSVLGTPIMAAIEGICSESIDSHFLYVQSIARAEEKSIERPAIR